MTRRSYITKKQYLCTHFQTSVNMKTIYSAFAEQVAKQPEALAMTDELIPYLRKQYGTLPIVLGGYSLGGLFSLWAASHTDVLTAVAAMSPSLWIANWAEYSAAHPVCTQYVYLSLGDREEFTRNRAVAQVGNNVRAEYAHLAEQLGTDRCTLEWNPGNHFADGAIRTAKGFAWCLSKLKNNPVSNEI